MSPIRTLLVDDHHLVLEGLRVLLAPLEYVELVGTATSAAEALRIARTLRPHVVLLDINLPDGSGVDVCRQLLAELPDLKIIALTTLSERSYVLQMLQAGAVGYMLKNVLPEELAAAITKVYAGKKYFSDEVQAMLTQPDAAALPTLTRREKEVLQLIAQGLTSSDMAEYLHLSILTIETHRRSLLTKFEVNNAASLIRRAAHLFLV
ncbi:response regulator [Hymenobacter lapidiphilus]|uniref:Response regulator transcription factor n=1 Tax=Hymenobacter lapidiphilus TaxID=2608003 RepID=A0A7Y7PRW2_9BACT|nr:response regulator transcription factor [Hymenobacter lapidiphilus]NVO32883.1 response regulator transcription factor [Hymenobacter lapidiphilus]